MWWEEKSILNKEEQVFMTLVVTFKKNYRLNNK